MLQRTPIGLMTHLVSTHASLYQSPVPGLIPPNNDKEVQVGKDQEKAQSEKDSHSKNQGGKKPNQQSGTYTMKTFRKPNEQLFSQ